MGHQATPRANFAFVMPVKVVPDLEDVEHNVTLHFFILWILTQQVYAHPGVKPSYRAIRLQTILPKRFMVTLSFIELVHHQ